MLDHFDDRQREAALHPPIGLLVVTSGAGTGKTSVLIQRIVSLVSGGMEPSRIMAVTFTRDAVSEMRERLAAASEACTTVQVKTLHSLAVSLLHRHGGVIGWHPGTWTVASQADVMRLLRQALEETGIALPTPDEDNDLMREAKRAFERWKENGIGLEAAEAAGADAPVADDMTQFLDAFILFQRAMREAGLMDFSDMTLEAVRMLEASPAVLRRIQDSLDYLLVDEAQDLNRLQLRFVQLLSARAAVTVVGDDDQGLYGFRGSMPRLMERVHEMLPEVAARGHHEVRLVQNRRCTEQCLRPANALVSYNRRSSPKVLTSGRDGQAVSVRGFQTENVEASRVAGSIAKLLEHGSTLDDIVVLGRVRRVLEPIELALRRQGIPCYLPAGGFAERQEVSDVAAYLTIALHPESVAAFSVVCQRPARGFGASSVERVIGLAQASGGTLHAALRSAVSRGLLKGKNAETASLLAFDLETLATAAQNDEPAEWAIRFILGKIGYRQWATARKNPPKTLAYSFAAMQGLARDAASFTDLLSCLSSSAEPEVRMAGAVDLMTMHGAKGREWKNVFIVGLEHEILPHARALGGRRQNDDPWDVQTSGGLDEERRLLHVALTRAKETAHVSFSMERRHRDGMRAQRPSSFLYESGLGVPAVKQGLAALQRAKEQRSKSR